MVSYKHCVGVSVGALSISIWPEMETGLLTGYPVTIAPATASPRTHRSLDGVKSFEFFVRNLGLNLDETFFAVEAYGKPVGNVWVDRMEMGAAIRLFLGSEKLRYVEVPMKVAYKFASGRAHLTPDKVSELLAIRLPSNRPTTCGPTNTDFEVGRAFLLASFGMTYKRWAQNLLEVKGETGKFFDSLREMFRPLDLFRKPLLPKL